MTATQTAFSYEAVAGQGVPGQLYGAGLGYDIVSAAFENTSPPGIYAGKCLISGTDGLRQCKVPAATGDVTGGKVKGVSIYEPARGKRASGYDFDTYDSISILRKGLIWVLSEDTIVQDAALFVRFTANGGNLPGNFRSDADTDKAVALPGAKVVKGRTGAGLILIEVNLP